jgi:excinuclease UvrABC ATPase subunit
MGVDGPPLLSPRQIQIGDLVLREIRMRLKFLLDVGLDYLSLDRPAERDEDTIRAADYIVDIGPGAGVHGGHIVAEGGFNTLISAEDSLTGAYLSGRRAIPTPAERRDTGSRKLTLVGCARNNLFGVDVEFLLGRLVCVNGVSVSGKSTR